MVCGYYILNSSGSSDERIPDRIDSYYRIRDLIEILVPDKMEII